jgi:hypothetical protein
MGSEGALRTAGGVRWCAETLDNGRRRPVRDRFRRAERGDEEAIRFVELYIHAEPFEFMAELGCHKLCQAGGMRPLRLGKAGEGDKVDRFPIIDQRRKAAQRNSLRVIDQNDAFGQVPEVPGRQVAFSL